LADSQTTDHRYGQYDSQPLTHLRVSIDPTDGVVKAANQIIQNVTERGIVNSSKMLPK
jgi:hypothetical protein